MVVEKLPLGCPATPAAFKFTLSATFWVALGVCSAVALLGALSYATLAAPSGMKLVEDAEVQLDPLIA